MFFLLVDTFPIIGFLPPIPSAYAVPIHTSTFFTKLFPLSEIPPLPHCSYKILETSRTFSEQLSSQFLLIYSPMLYSFTMSTDFSVVLFTCLSPLDQVPRNRVSLSCSSSHAQHLAQCPAESICYLLNRSQKGAGGERKSGCIWARC